MGTLGSLESQASQPIWDMPISIINIKNNLPIQFMWLAFQLVSRSVVFDPWYFPYVLGRIWILNKTDNLKVVKISLSDQINFGGSTKIFDRIKFRRFQNYNMLIYENLLNQKKRSDFEEDEPVHLLMKQCICWENNRK